MKYLGNAWRPVEKKLDRAKRIGLFLDYDGTLAPIVRRPALAGMDRETADLLEALARNGKFVLGIISGRTLADIKKRIGLKGIFYAGNHGMELETPEGESLIPGRGTEETMQGLAGLLSPAVERIPCAYFENKRVSLSVHYRRCGPREIPRLRRIVFRTLAAWPKKVAVTRGKKVWDIRPAYAWDKGKAVIWMLRRSGPARGLLPVYIGDDRTDEDAFRALRGRGITVRVCRKKSSAAGYYVTGVSEVKQCLKQLLQS